MAILYVDGFDHFDPQALKPDGAPNYGYGKATYSTVCERVPGRRGASYGLKYPANTQGTAMIKYLDAGVSTMIVGCGIKISTFPSYQFPLLFIRTTTGTNFEVKVDSLGSLMIDNGGVTAGQSMRAIAPQTWNYIELKIVEGNGTAVFELQVNSEIWLSLTGQTTSTGGTLSKAGVCWADQAYPVEIHFDDFYMADGSGTTNNDFLGDVRIDAIHPNGPGSFTQWVPSVAGGANWDMVNEPLPDHSDYVTAANAGDRDSYTFEPLPAMNTPTILGVQVAALAKKTDAGAGTLKALTKSATATVTGQAQALTTSPTYLTTVFETTADGTPWTEADFNTAEFGIEKG